MINPAAVFAAGRGVPPGITVRLLTTPRETLLEISFLPVSGCLSRALGVG